MGNEMAKGKAKECNEFNQTYHDRFFHNGCAGGRPIGYQNRLQDKRDRDDPPGDDR